MQLRNISQIADNQRLYGHSKTIEEIMKEISILNQYHDIYSSFIKKSLRR